jgi:aspartate aminotransferase/aminotransferase
MLMGGFSKTYAMTGWRLGYAAGPHEILEQMKKLQQFSFVCAPSFAQEAGVVALDCNVDSLVRAYARKRDLIYKGLLDAGYEVTKPHGAFYIFPKAPWGSDVEFVATAIKNNVLVIPGSVFSERHTHFRISYATTDDEIRRGVDALARLKDKFCGR